MAMTPNGSDNSPPGHDEELMPWLATGHQGGLSDRHLGADPEITAHGRQIREEAAAAAADNEARGRPSPAVLDRVMESIAREAAPRHETFRARVQRWLEPLQVSSGPARAMAVAAALVVAAQAGVIGYLVTERAPERYQTASGEDTSAPTEPGFLLRFESDANATAIAAALREAGVTIVDGPRAGGFYRVALSAPEVQSIDDAEEALRGSSVITTLLPADTSE